MDSKIKYVLITSALFFLSACQTVPSSDKNIDDLTIADPNESMNGEWVTYGENYRGYLVKPLEEGTYPGIIMIHEWWGVNQNIINMAHKLAQEGYVVLAVDLYNGNVAETPENAKAYATAVRNNIPAAIAQMQSAVMLLKEQEEVTNSIGSLGWCFGGQMSLQLSLNEALDATVIYYGSLETEEQTLQKLKGPVLGIFGEQDTSIPVDTVKKFETALNNLKITNEVYIYQGVGHAFANPSNAGYSPENTEDAWKKTLVFLEANLK